MGPQGLDLVNRNEMWLSMNAITKSIFFVLSIWVIVQIMTLPIVLIFDR